MHSPLPRRTKESEAGRGDKKLAISRPGDRGVRGGKLGVSADCRAQGAVAFEPGIGAIPTGQFLPVTPVVSADRRYVRLTLSPSFNALVSLTPFNFPGGAVSGNLMGGMNGATGGGGAGVGGGGVGVGGGTTTSALGQPLAGTYPPPGMFGDLSRPVLTGASTLDGTLSPLPSLVENQPAAQGIGDAPAVSQTVNSSTRTAVNSSTSQRRTARKPVRKSKSTPRYRYTVRNFDPFAESY